MEFYFLGVFSLKTVYRFHQKLLIRLKKVGVLLKIRWLDRMEKNLLIAIGESFCLGKRSRLHISQ